MSSSSGAVQRLHHVEDAELVGPAREREAAADAAVPGDQTGAPQRGEELLQVLLRDAALVREVGEPHGAAAAARAQVELDEREQRVPAL